MKDAIFNTGLVPMCALCAVLTFLALPASATCLSGPLCEGTSPTIPQQPVNDFPDFAVNFEAATHGVGNAQTEIVAGVGEVFASRDSGSDIDFEAFLNSGLCVTDCEDGGFNASVRVYERVTSGGYAISEGGAGTIAAMEGVSNAFTTGSMNITFPTLEN